MSTTRINKLAQSLLLRRAPKARSLIVTLFGDCVSQQGGSVWLGSLIRVLESFRINERATRSAVFRLVQDDWLAVVKGGRRSYYRFAAHGQREYGRAARRVYSVDRPRWDGAWTLAMLHGVTGRARKTLRTSLGWIGFAQLTNGVFAHPSADRAALTDLIDELGVARHVLIVDARITQREAVSDLARARWRLPELATRYRRFIGDFEPFRRIRSDASPQLCFVIRTLLIHEYRRILLTDPDLPDALLPVGWPGRVAAELTRGLYTAITGRATRYAMETLENESGCLPKPDAAFFDRFSNRTAQRSQASSRPRSRVR